MHQKEYTDLRIISWNNVTLCYTKSFEALQHLGSFRSNLNVSPYHEQ